MDAAGPPVIPPPSFRGHQLAPAARCLCHAFFTKVLHVLVVELRFATKVSIIPPSFSRFMPLPDFDFDEVDHASGRLRVLFGQPVKLGGAGFAVIRTALGADMLVDGLCRGNSFIDNGEADDAALDHFLAQANPTHWS